jgi:hypothetical protein
MNTNQKIAFCVVVLSLSLAIIPALLVANHHAEINAQAPRTTEDWWPVTGQCNYIYGVAYGPAVLIHKYDYGYEAQRIDTHESEAIDAQTVCTSYESQGDLEAAWPYTGNEIGATYEAPANQ